MLLGVERRERDPPALKRDPLGPLARARVDQGAAGLRGDRGRHGGDFLEASHELVHVRLGEVLALEQKSRSGGLGACVGQAIGEIQARRMFALAIFLEAGDGGGAYRGIDRRLDDIGFIKKFFVLALRLARRH